MTAAPPARSSTRAPAVFVAAAAALLGAAAPAAEPPEGAPRASITWEVDFAAALEPAKAENKVVAIAINMDGERANDVMAGEHYRDKRLAQLSEHTVNLFCSAFEHGKKCSRVDGVTCEQHKAIDKRVRLDVLGIAPTELVVAPQHVFLTPGGKIICAVPYYMTVGQLEWVWAYAIRKVSPDFEWELGERAHAPRRLKIEAADTTRIERKPPTVAEVEAALKKLKKGMGYYFEAKEDLPMLARHPGGEARNFTKRLLDSFETSAAERVEILGTIGDNSPRVWWSTVVPYLAHEEETVRLAAARALEKLAEKKAVKPMKGRFKREPSVAVKGVMLRAMAASDPGSRSVHQLLHKVLRTGDHDALRAQAAFACVGVEDRKAVDKAIGLALDDDATTVRATAALVIATRREEGLRARLSARHELERDADTKKWMKAALGVLDGGDLTEFDPLFAELLR